MINSKKIVVVMPAYNASETLEKTYNEIPFPLVDEVILVDDHGSGFENAPICTLVALQVART